MTHGSLRARLLTILLTATGAVWLLTAVGNWFDTRHEMGEMFDAQLAQAARTLLSLSSHELDELRDVGGTEAGHIHFIPRNLGALTGHRHENRVAYQIWSAESGRLLIRSEQAPPLPLSDVRHGFSDRTVNGERWRVFSLADTESDFMVQIGESYHDRNALANESVARLSLPMLLALPVLGLLIWFGVGRALLPLTQLTRQIGDRAPERLEPVAADSAPQEIAPLVTALNRLFERLQRAFDNERRFTADAAHELRTPLAALRTQAEVALRAADDAGRRQALQQVLRGVDRATHLVQQLLTLARLDPEGGLPQPSTVELCALATEVLVDLDGAALAKSIELSLREPCAGTVTGNAHSLAALLRNLVENAIRYTPAGGRVEVAIDHRETHIQVQVEDSGPGIPEEERDRVFDRFFRRPGSEGDGSGLGLSIVRRIVELHHGDIALSDSPLGGLKVTVSLPGKAAAPH